MGISFVLHLTLHHQHPCWSSCGKQHFKRSACTSQNKYSCNMSQLCSCWHLSMWCAKTSLNLCFPTFMWIASMDLKSRSAARSSGSLVRNCAPWMKSSFSSASWWRCRTPVIVAYWGTNWFVHIKCMCPIPKIFWSVPYIFLSVTLSGYHLFTNTSNHLYSPIGKWWRLSSLRIQVFWDMTPCCWASGFWCPLEVWRWRHCAL